MTKGPPPAGITIGRGVRGTALLGVDHFYYFETLAARKDFPALIYTRDVTKLRRQTAPFVLDEQRTCTSATRAGRASSRSRPPMRGDDDGHGSFVFDCRLLDVAPEGLSVTTTYPRTAAFT